MSVIPNLESMLAEGQDNSLIRFGLANAYHYIEDFERALAHYKEALVQDSRYIAAWKMYAKTLLALGQYEEAKKAYLHGASLAEEKGDYAAAKSIRVELKALRNKMAD